MMGKIFSAIFLLAAFAVQASAQYYKVSVKVTGDKNINFPAAEFMLEPGKSQMKGFEARLNPAGFGANGFKPARLLEAEIREKYEEALEKELSRKPEEKLDDALEMLEARARGLEMYMEQPNGGQKNGAAPRGRAVQKKSEAESKVSANLTRKKIEAEKAREKYEDFKKQVEKAKRNRALLKEMVEEIDKKTAENLKLSMLRDSVHDAGYPYGTYHNISLKKVADKHALIDFESAVSFMTGWMHVDGNNNNNSINSSAKIEYVDMPKLEDVTVELGKPYCFQIARPEEKGGTLNEALDGTTIFARSLDPNNITPMNTKAVEDFNANPLNRNGPLAEIQKTFKGREREVVRVVVTITKQ